MIKGGYYIKARCIKNSEIATSPPCVREIWDWLIREANHKDCKYGKNIIKRGQLFRTYKDIREGLSWYIGWKKMMYSENHTKRAMKALREYRMITTKKELGGVLITICNYDIYQNPNNYERTSESTIESTTRGTIAEPKCSHTNKNDKNDKNDKKELGGKIPNPDHKFRYKNDDGDFVDGTYGSFFDAVAKIYKGNGNFLYSNRIQLVDFITKNPDYPILPALDYEVKLAKTKNRHAKAISTVLDNPEDITVIDSFIKSKIRRKTREGI